MAWNETDMVAAFMECPDVFPLGSTGKYVAIASLYNWHAGGYYTNEWFLGTIANSTRFVLEDRGLLDYGQYYAARTGTAMQDPLGRRVLFSVSTRQHVPPNTQTQTHSHTHTRARAHLFFSLLPTAACL